MGFSFWLFVCFLVAVVRQEAPPNELVYRRSGNVSIFGVFSIGSQCDGETLKRVEEAAAAIWTIEALNNYNYLPGVSIGLSVIGVCENSDLNHVSKWIEEDARKQDTLNIGTLTTGEIYDRLEATQKSNVLLIKHIIDSDLLTELVVQLLTNLQWVSVNVVASDSTKTLKAFIEKTTQEGIHVEEQLLLDDRLERLRISGVMVIIAPFAKIANVTRDQIHNETVQLILVPTDFVFGQIPDLPRNAVILLPAAEDEHILSKFINNPERHKDFFSHRGPTKSPLFLGTAASVLRMLQPVKSLVGGKCTEVDVYPKEPCAAVVDFIDDMRRNKIALLPHNSSNDLPDDVEATLGVLKIEAMPNDEMFLYIAFVGNEDGGGSEDLAIFQIFNPRTPDFNPILLMINEDMVSDRGMMNKTHLRTPLIELLVSGSVGNLKAGDEPRTELTTTPNIKQACDEAHHTCQNSDGNQSKAIEINDTVDIKPAVVWRFLTWVSINTALGVIGILCTLSIILFLVIRICKGYTLEGSPYFMLLLMLSVIVVYGSSLPFHIDGDGLICCLRVNAPPGALTLLFSLLLSRSFMSAFSQDEAGFVNHINGYLQSILCLFMLGIQATMTSQNWTHNCPEIHTTHKILIALGYNFLLLFLLVCVCPFIIRSKRHFREGLLFSISVFFTVVVWAIWVSFYISLSEEHKDAAVAIGLNSTATITLFCILIPRTYSLAGSISPDKAIRSLQYLDRNILSVDKSTDSVFGTYTRDVGVPNPNFSEGHVHTIDVAPDTPRR